MLTPMQITMFPKIGALYSFKKALNSLIGKKNLIHHQLRVFITN